MCYCIVVALFLFWTILNLRAISNFPGAYIWRQPRPQGAFPSKAREKRPGDEVDLEGVLIQRRSFAL